MNAEVIYSNGEHFVLYDVDREKWIHAISLNWRFIEHHNIFVNLNNVSAIKFRD